MKFLKIVFLLFLTSCSFASFSYYRSITLQGSQIMGTQTNYAVEIASGSYNLQNVNSGGHVQNVNGYDIGFYTNSNCSTGKMTWETESYSSTTGAGYWWVLEPSLTNGTNATLYLCYGDATISTDQSNASGVWNSNYRSVWHMASTTGTTISTKESTSLNNVFLSSYTLPSSTTGVIDGGALMGTWGATASIGTSSAPAQAYPFTFESWSQLSTTTLNNSDNIMVAYVSNSLDLAWYEYEGSGATGSYRMIACNNGCAQNEQMTCTVPSLDTKWHYIVGEFVSNSSFTIFTDGLPVSNGGTGGGVTISVATGTVISSDGYGAQDNAFQGNIDEVRISNIALPYPTIQTNYNMESNPSAFETVGNENSITPPGPTVTGCVVR